MNRAEARKLMKQGVSKNQAFNYRDTQNQLSKAECDNLVEGMLLEFMTVLLDKTALDRQDVIDVVRQMLTDFDGMNEYRFNMQDLIDVLRDEYKLEVNFTKGRIELYEL